MLSIFSLSSSGLEALHITASERLRDGERDELLACRRSLGADDTGKERRELTLQDIRDNALLELSRETGESNGWLRHCCIGRGVQVNDGERRVQVELPFY